MAVSALGYMGIGASDMAAWRTFGTRILGLELAEESKQGLRFRADDQAWRIAIEPSGENDIIYAGFELDSPAALKALASRLSDAGIESAEGDEALAKKRGVDRLIYARDPDGLRCEFYCSRTAAPGAPFRSPAGVDGFVTGEMGIGHMVLTASDMEATNRFYQDLLGFRYSDAIDMQFGDIGFRAVFLHCNPRHHTLAFAPIPSPKRLNHFMLQVSSLDDVGAALDRVQHADIPIRMSLGKHTNDHMVSFYAQTPSGFDVEYGYGAREIDDRTWEPQLYDSPSIWGHAFHNI